MPYEVYMNIIESLAILIKELNPSAEIPQSDVEKRQLFRALCNVRAPKPLSSDFLRIQDAMLRQMISAKGITDIRSLHPVNKDLYLWQGDITTLRVDAIVNAANSSLLGCFVPCHGCIDNAIHTFAGVQLRLECAEIMEKQGQPEPTGCAKITNAYNLPCRHVLHTVGPTVNDLLTEQHREQLSNCYRACLALAAKHGLQSIAFCCISTGEFHFPNRAAAEIAVQTVQEYQKHTRCRSFSTCSKMRIKVFMKNYSDDIQKARQLLSEADAIVVGAGAGLSMAAGMTYDGERFTSHFADYIEKYHFTDMYTAGFHPFATPEDKWGYWSRHIYLNRYAQPDNGLHALLHALLAGKPHFVLSTNVDALFVRNGFDSDRIFDVQGDYGKWQCGVPCHNTLYDNEATVSEMVAEQANCRIPTALLPKCPVCGELMENNLRADGRFVEDAHWHESSEKYSDFLRTYRSSRLVLLELGVGFNTPTFPDTVLIRINHDDCRTVYDIDGKTLCMHQDIAAVISKMM